VNSKVSSLLRSKWTIPVAVGTVSFGIGFAAGWFSAKKKTQEEVIDIVVNEDFQLKLVFDEDEYVGVEERDTVEVPRPVFVINEDDFAAYSDEELEGGETSMINVFTETDEDWDYELEIQNRVSSIPYVIHRDEFFGDEMGWDSQSTLTWYEGDQVLVDERDMPLSNPPSFIGNPTFGHGSGDPNVVYVRNEKFQAEYEVLRDPGSYEMDILGGHVESQMEREDFRHSRSPGKFRED
jgi:hypothetical protein